VAAKKKNATIIAEITPCHWQGGILAAIFPGVILAATLYVRKNDLRYYTMDACTFGKRTNLSPKGFGLSRFLEEHACIQYQPEVLHPILLSLIMVSTSGGGH